jgi:hypothetical protein
VRIIKELWEGGLGTADSKEVRMNYGSGTNWIDGHESFSFTGPPPVIKRYSNRRIIKGQEELRGVREEGEIEPVSHRQ